jgi:transcriptional regulator with XRE-family HTH domain
VRSWLPSPFFDTRHGGVVSSRAGVHVNVVGRIERGKYNPSVLVLDAIVSKLNVSLSRLFSAVE